MVLDCVEDNWDGRLQHHVFTADDGPLASRARGMGIACRTFPLNKKRYIAPAMVLIAKYAKEVDADLIVARGQYAAFASAIASLISGRRFLYVAAYPSFYADYDFRRRIRNKTVEWVSCRAASRVIVLSQSDRYSYLDRNLTSDEKIMVIPNSVRVSPPRPHSNNAPLKVGFLGRLVHWKGVDVLLQAAGLLLEEGNDLEILVAGEGPELVRLTDLARSLKIESRVNFVGPQQDPLNFLRQLDIAVVPSVVEPFGIVTVEAMSVGVPVVASNVGGPGEILAEPGSGILVPPGQPVALAAAISMLMSDDDLRRQMGEAGRVVACETYGPELFRERYRAAYLAAMNAI